jgi:hypothetical protein
MPTQKYMPSDFSQEIKLPPNPNSGTILDVSSRPRVPKVKSSQSMRSLRGGPITSKLSVLSFDMNQEPETTICINNTEMCLWTVQSVNSTQRWPVTTEPHRTQSPSSELQSSTRRAKSEDPDPVSTEIIKSNFQFSELLSVQVKKDTEIFSKLTDQIPSANDHKYLNLIKAYLSIFISIISIIRNQVYV